MVTDSETGVVTTYYYDLLNRQSGYREKSSSLDHSVRYEYDAKNNLSSMTETVNGTTKTYSYSYNSYNRLTSMTVDGVTVAYTYDDFGRLTKQETKQGETVILTEEVGYSAGIGENTTSGQIASYNGFTYTYDKNGNILSVSDGTHTTSYEYDSQNQLTRENNQAQGYTHVWEYDNAGNIKSRTEYAYTNGTLGSPTGSITYTYNTSIWRDLLRSYGNSARFSYDNSGNITSDGVWTYWWKHGRQLAYMKQGSTIRWDYTYDANGLRTKRTDGTNTYTYVYNGSKLVQMSSYGYTYNFTYDANGTPLTVTVNNYTYYYVTNLQGDVIGILDEDGEQVITYQYTAWGAVTVIGDEPIGTFNPLRYRGYVYDNETALYYLQSRYYNPEWGRFLNADEYSATGQGFIGNNMFSYCLNNPVNATDECGNIPDSYSGWVGEQIGIFLYEWITGNDHPQHQVNEINNQIMTKQMNIAGNVVIEVWNAYQRGYALEQEMQRMTTEMTLPTVKRILRTGTKTGIETAIITGVTDQLKGNSNNQTEPKAIAISMAISFTGGFIAGAVMEMWTIFKEILAD